MHPTHRPWHGRLVLGALTSGAVVVGCALGPGTAPPEGGVVVEGQVQLRGGTIKGRRLMAQVEAPQAKDVRYLKIWLRRLAPNPTAETEVGVLPGLSQPIQLRGLRHHTTYRVRLEATNMEASRLDANATSVATPNLGDSETEFATTDLPLLSGVSFRLRLQDQVFDGEAQGNVAVQAGQWVPNGQPEHAASDAFTPIGSVWPAAFIHKDSRLYLVKVNEFTPGYHHFHTNPIPLAESHPDYSGTAPWAGCPAVTGAPPYYPFSPEVWDNSGDQPYQGVVTTKMLVASRIGYHGVRRGDGSLHSVPVYNWQFLMDRCSAL